MSSEIIKIHKHNAVYHKVECSNSVAYEIADLFTFFAHGYRFHPLYKNRVWDGKIRMFSTKTRLLYGGHVEHVRKFCANNGYELQVDEEIELLDEISLVEAKLFIADLNLPSHFETREYQVDYFVHCVRNKRALIISPTGSGKSLNLYFLVRWYQKKTLIIVDSISLLKQMSSDFREYGFDVDKNIHHLHGGEAEKTSSKWVTLSTWQSCSRQPKSWFDQFDLVIGDEAHKFRAKELKKIMEHLTTCQYRFGFTGSLDGSQVNELTLEGLFGPKEQKKTTRELIDEGHLSNLKIKAILLKYPDEIRKSMNRTKYQDEIAFLCANEKRNKFIENLALSLEGNTLLLFQRVEEHGVPLFRNLKERSGDVPIYYISGMIEGDEREEIRKIVNTHQKSITVASVGTTATGLNIPNLNNIIMASPTKSVTRVLQSIGRGTRKTDIKTECAIYDIADNLSWKKHKNYTLEHFMERVKIYINQNFEYKIYKVQL